jgi:hypothetical protein
MELKIAENGNSKSDEKIETNRTAVIYLTVSLSPEVLKFDRKKSTKVTLNIECETCSGISHYVESKSVQNIDVLQLFSPLGIVKDDSECDAFELRG